MMGLTCIACLLINIYYKIQSETLIFILNPCHVCALAIGVLSLSKYSLKSEFLALYIFSSAFGGWIGLIFAENEELPIIELSVYYIQHFFTSFLGPLVLSLSGRFDPLTYAAFPLPVCGFHLFCLYMRLFLCPMALISWANLNHTLCGVDNDPFYANFDMGQWYYLWADLYLLFSCYVGLVLNFAICYIVKVLIFRQKVQTANPKEKEDANEMDTLKKKE